MAGSSRTLGAGGVGAQRSAVVSCWMCGIRLHEDEMVPDGLKACTDVRWYCQDSAACTQRWTSAKHRTLAGRAMSPEAAVLADPGGSYPPAADRAASSSWTR